MALDTILNVTLNSRGAEQQIERLTSKNYGIKLNIDSQPLGRITGQLGEFNKSMDAANARVVAFGASAGAIAILEKSFHALIDSTIEVQKAMNGIQVLLGVSDGLMSKFGKNLFDIAKNTGQSFDTVAEAATNLSRQGLGMEETLKRTNDALVLSRLTGMGAAESVRALTAAVNSFSSQAVTATEIVNKFATVDSSFAIGAKDLPEAISRVGSAAAQAGVSLDELIGLVTSAQVATARGGSVIGNSFKTIFTRLERGKTQDLLESLGVSTKDSEGKLKSTIDMLKDLARVYGTLSQGQQASVAEKVGGVFQINILKAALADLGKEHSVYASAVAVSNNATDEAAKRNAKLNETYAAQINRLQQNATQFAATAGKQVFGPSMDRIIGAGNGILDSLNNADTSSVGAKLGKGLLDGIGQVLAGPGLALIGGVIIKLLGDFSKFAGGSVKELLGLNGASKEQEAIQASITKMLEKNPSLLAQINSEAKTQNDQAKILLDHYTKQTAQMELQAKLTSEIASKLYSGGVRMGSQGVPVSKKASGYIPEFASEEAQARMLGARNPRAMWSNGTIGGQRFVKNSEEDEIVGYGSNGDSAVIPRYAGGYIPNFASKAEKEEREKRRLLTEKRRELKEARELAGAPMLLNDSPTNQIGLIFGKKTSGINEGVTGMFEGKEHQRYILKFNEAGLNLPSAIKPDDADIEGKLGKNLIAFTNTWIKKLGGYETNKISDIGQLANAGSFSSIVGTVFETAVSKATGTDDREGGQIARVDFGSPNDQLRKLFHNLPANRYEAKYTNSQKLRNSVALKAYEEHLLDGLITKAENKRAATKAAGYVPNFADALHDSIAREIGAGAPADDIYIKKYGQLANESNPDGYGVFNKRDEGSMSKEMQAIRRKGYARGYIPNFADDDTSTAGIANGAVASIADLALTFSLLKNSSGEATKALKEGATGLEKLGARLSDFKTGGGLTNAAIFAPLIANQVAQFIPQNSNAGRGSASILTGAGNIASAAGTGAMLGSAIGPEGTLIGAGIGVAIASFTEIPKVVNAFNSKLPDLTKKADEAKDSFEKISTASKSYLAINEQMKDARASGNQRLEAKLQEQQNENFSKFSPEQQERIISATKNGNLDEEMGKVLEEVSQLNQKAETLKSLETIKDKIGFFNQQIGKKDLDEVVQNVKQQAFGGMSPQEQRAAANKFTDSGGFDTSGYDLPEKKENFEKGLKNLIPGDKNSELRSKLIDTAKNEASLYQLEAALTNMSRQALISANNAELQTKAQSNSNDAMQNANEILGAWISRMKAYAEVQNQLLNAKLDTNQRNVDYDTKTSIEDRGFVGRMAEKVAGKSPESINSEYRDKLKDIDENRNKDRSAELTNFLKDRNNSTLKDYLSSYSDEKANQKTDAAHLSTNAFHRDSSKREELEAEGSTNKFKEKYAEFSKGEQSKLDSIVSNLNNNEKIQSALKSEDSKAMTVAITEQLKQLGETNEKLSDKQISEFAPKISSLLIKLGEIDQKTGQEKDSARRSGIMQNTEMSIDTRMGAFGGYKAFMDNKSPGIAEIGGALSTVQAEERRKAAIASKVRNGLLRGQLNPDGSVNRNYESDDYTGKDIGYRKEVIGGSNLGRAYLKLNERYSESLGGIKLRGGGPGQTGMEDEITQDIKNKSNENFNELLKDAGYYDHSGKQLSKEEQVSRNAAKEYINAYLNQVMGGENKDYIQGSSVSDLKGYGDIASGKVARFQTYQAMGDNKKAKEEVGEEYYKNQKISEESKQDLLENGNQAEKDSAAYLLEIKDTLNSLNDGKLAAALNPSQTPATQPPASSHAAGYLPTMMAEERAAQMLGAVNPRAMMGRGTIGGKRFMMNNQEIEIPGYGRNGDSAVIPMYAAGNMPELPKDGGYWRMSKSGKGELDELKKLLIKRGNVVQSDIYSHVEGEMEIINDYIDRYTFRFDSMNGSAAGPNHYLVDGPKGKNIENMGGVASVINTNTPQGEEYIKNYLSNIRRNDDLKRMGLDANATDEQILQAAKKIDNYGSAGRVSTGTGRNMNMSTRSFDEIKMTPEVRATIEEYYKSKNITPVTQAATPVTTETSRPISTDKTLQTAREIQLREQVNAQKIQTEKIRQEIIQKQENVMKTKSELPTFDSASANEGKYVGGIPVEQLEENKKRFEEQIKNKINFAAKAKEVAAIGADMHKEYFGQNIMKTLKSGISGIQKNPKAALGALGKGVKGLGVGLAVEYALDKIIPESSNDYLNQLKGTFIAGASGASAGGVGGAIAGLGINAVQNGLLDVIAFSKLVAINVSNENKNTELDKQQKALDAKKIEVQKILEQRKHNNENNIAKYATNNLFHDQAKPEFHDQAKPEFHDQPRFEDLTAQLDAYKKKSKHKIEDMDPELYWARYGVSSAKELQQKQAAEFDKHLNDIPKAGGQSSTASSSRSGKLAVYNPDGTIKRQTTYNDSPYARRYIAAEEEYLRQNPVNKSKYSNPLHIDDPAHGMAGYSAGYMPDVVSEIMSAKRLGANNPRAMIGEGTIGGRKFMMNSEEIEIPRYGRNGDSAVIPKYAGGNIPDSGGSKNSVNIPVSLNVSVNGGSGGKRNDSMAHDQADALHRNVNSLIPELKQNIEKVVQETFARRIGTLEGQVDRLSQSNQAGKPRPYGIAPGLTDGGTMKV